jgi:hypothetical protein
MLTVYEENNHRKIARLHETVSTTTAPNIQASVRQHYQTARFSPAAGAA